MKGTMSSHRMYHSNDRHDGHNRHDVHGVYDGDDGLIGMMDIMSVLDMMSMVGLMGIISLCTHAYTDRSASPCALHNARLMPSFCVHLTCILRASSAPFPLWHAPGSSRAIGGALCCPLATSMQT